MGGKHVATSLLKISGCFCRAMRCEQGEQSVMPEDNVRGLRHASVGGGYDPDHVVFVHGHSLLLPHNVSAVDPGLRGNLHHVRGDAGHSDPPGQRECGLLGGSSHHPPVVGYCLRVQRPECAVAPL